MSNNIKIKRGLKAGLPNLEVGEFGLATDTNEVFIGTPTGNELVNVDDYELTKPKIDTALIGGDIGSLQLGQNAIAEGENSTALGQSASAVGDYSTALGRLAHASGNNSTALGRLAHAEGLNSTAIGYNARAEGLNSIAIGSDTKVTEDNVADFGSNTQVRVNETPVNDRDAVSKKYLEDSLNQLDTDLSGIIDSVNIDLSGRIDDIESGKQDKLVAGDNITIDENNEISASGVVKSINGQTPNANGLVQFSYAALNNKPDLFSGDYNDLTNKPDIPNVNDVVTLTDDQTISGAKTFSRQLKITNAGHNPGLLLDSDAYVIGASGSIMADMIEGKVTNDDGKTSKMFIIGTYGIEEFGGLPRPYYMYLDSRIDGNYDTATLKVDAENRVGVATGYARPTQALDVGGKIRMRTQTVAEDADDIVVTKGFVDASINTLNHDIVLISDTEFTITQAHFNKTLIITSSDDVTITVPTQIVESIEKGFFCDIVRYGTGEVSFSGAGIVLNSAGALSIDAQYIAASLIKIDDNNEWLLIGGRE